MRRKNGPNCSCDQAAHLRAHGTACEHWEAVLGPVAGKTGDGKRLVYTDRLDHFETLVTPESLHIEYEEAAQLQRAGMLDADEKFIDQEKVMRSKMSKLGLSAKKVAVVVDRVLSGKTFKEIARDVGYSEASSAAQAYKDAMNHLKKRGYK
jgi:hypothetical protein